MQNACDAHHDSNPEIEGVGIAGSFVQCYFYVYDSDLLYVIAIQTFCDYP